MPSKMKVLSGLPFLAGLVITVSGKLGGSAYENHLITLMLDSERLSASYSAALPLQAAACYGDFGCFTKDTIAAFPEPPSFINPKFRLYTPESDDTAKVYGYHAAVGDEDEATKQSLRDKSKKLVFVSHGFGGDGNLDWLQAIRNASTKLHGNNVIVVDWAKGARAATLYIGAAANSQLVGRIVAHLCLKLVNKYGIPLTNVEFVGFSLGAQVAGFFAKDIFEKTGEKVGKVTALDCAAPLFETHGVYPSKEHIKFLEAVHTAAGNILWRGKVGIGKDYGHVDYYPNGGIDQPGCLFLDLACAHNRAHDYYLEAVSCTDDCLYQGFPCDSVEKASTGDCDPVIDQRHFISQGNSSTEHAIFFLRTRSTKPYCMDDYKL